MDTKMKIFTLICGFLIIVGCSNDGSSEKSNQVVKPIEDTPVESESFSYVYPLTGIPTNEDINHRVVSVMINNAPEARPQSGLHKADVVYEVLAEGNITRFLALYQSEQPEIIGPVRSARDYFIDLSKGYDALYIAHGYSTTAKKRLVAGEIDNINGMQYDGTLFWRADYRVAPHNSYISFENIKKGAEKNQYSLNEEVPPLYFMNEQEIENIQGTRATNVMIAYSKSEFSTVEYLYDESTKKYKRFSGGEQTLDYETKTPILLDNIFIVEADHHVIDNKGRRDIDLTSGGNGYLIQHGVTREVQWKNVEGRIVPFMNGQEIGFVPGKIWINVIPTSPGLTGAVSFDVNE